MLPVALFWELSVISWYLELLGRRTCASGTKRFYWGTVRSEGAAAGHTVITKVRCSRTLAALGSQRKSLVLVSASQQFQPSALAALVSGGLAIAVVWAELRKRGRTKGNRIAQTRRNECGCEGS